MPPIGGAPELVGGGKPGWCIGGMVGIVGGPGGRLVGGIISGPIDEGGAVGAPLYGPCCKKKNNSFNNNSFEATSQEYTTRRTSRTAEQKAEEG